MIEYVAELAGERVSGEASVKIVCAKNPAIALREFYELDKSRAELSRAW